MKSKVLLILLVPIAITIIALIIILIWVIAAINSNEHTAPVFFSLDDPTAYYSIKKTDSINFNYPIYLVVHNNDSVFVGNSKIELDPFVGKKVIIKGDYSGRIGKQQCIVNKCHPLEGAMIDIESIKLLYSIKF
ncbi:MAG: hypothetical protein ABIC96_01965 [Patescibacteria group bacterium]